MFLLQWLKNTLTYLCLKENVICLQPRRDKLPGLQREKEAELQLRKDQKCVGVLLLKNHVLEFACYLFNIVDIFRGLTNKKKPKYYGKRSKCGILVLRYMIVGIKLEWLAFHNGGPPLCDRGGIFYSFSDFFYLLWVFLCFSADLGSEFESKAEFRTFTLNCLLDEPACSKDLRC